MYFRKRSKIGVNLKNDEKKKQMRFRKFKKFINPISITNAY